MLHRGFPTLPLIKSINHGRRLHNSRHMNGLNTLTHALNTDHS